ILINMSSILPTSTDPFPGRHSRPRPPPTVRARQGLPLGVKSHTLTPTPEHPTLRGKLQYLVHWNGYGYEENSWVEESNVNAPRLVKEFHRWHTAAPCRIQVTDFGCM
ncbi:hypothetical protein L208DRAFT_1238320, partial [Tricholoma matsutake]